MSLAEIHSFIYSFFHSSINL